MKVQNVRPVHRRAPLIGVICGVITLGGCGANVIETRSTKLDTALVLSADNRVILSESSQNNGPVTCAEPQPDAIRAVAQEFAAALKGANLPVEGSAGGAFREAVAELGRRTPSIQLMRDVLYRNCEMVMNGILTEQDILLIAPQIDNLIVGTLAIDSLASIGQGGGTGAAISAAATGTTTAAPGSAASPAGTLTTTANTGGAPVATLDAKSVEAIANATVKIVEMSLELGEHRDLTREAMLTRVMESSLLASARAPR